MMTANEMKAKCEAILERWEDENDTWYIGIRFEYKERQVGETCECSKHNVDREDERDFPEYGTAEYEEMFELDGTSAWNLETYEDWYDQGRFGSLHCYIIVGDNITNKDDALDDNEIVIEDAVVYAQVF